MPKCPLHQGEKLEPKRKGWFCEECGAIVLGYDSIPAPEGVLAEKQAKPPKPHRPKAHSLPFPISEGTPTFSISRSQPDLLRGDAVTRWALAPGAVHSAKETLRSLASGGISSSLYVRRSGIDDALPLCFARPRRGLLVVGAPGSGKTTLLARLVRQALGLDPGLDQSDAVSDVEEQDIVLFV